MVKTAIDHDTVAAQVYAKTFHTEVTTTESFLGMSVIPLHTFLCEDFNARSMRAIQNIQQHEIWTASLPCQLWSSASRKAGLQSPEGRVWHEFARAISIARPRCILLENVAPLVEHEHWPMLRNLFTDAKYRIAWQTVQDGLEHVSCTNRRRWLAILIDSLTPFRDPAPFTVMWQALQPIKLSLRAVAAKHTAGDQAQRALDVISHERQQLFIRRCNSESFTPCDWLSPIDSDSVCIVLPLEAPWNFHEACEVARLLENIHESNLSAIRARKMQQFHVMRPSRLMCARPYTSRPPGSPRPSRDTGRTASKACSSGLKNFSPWSLQP